MSDVAEKLSGLSREERALLFQRLRQKKVQDRPAADDRILPRQDAGAPPLSFAQQRFWFLDRLRPGDPSHNIAAAHRIAGPLDPGALHRALQVVVDRHESLRTTFRLAGDVPAQVVAPCLEIALPVIDLAASPRAEEAVERLWLQESRRAFDLAAGPLLRMTLLRLGPREHVLLVVMHHIISDGWSMGVLIRETVQLYQAFRSGAAPDLPALPIQYADFAVWQREWLSGARLEEQLAWWRQRLGGMPQVLDLPTDRPRPPQRSSEGSWVDVRLDPDTAGRLKALARSRSTTLFVAVLATFQTLLYRWSGQADIPVGTPIANRNRVETTGLIGFFVNTLVLRGDLSRDPSARELVEQLGQAAIEAYAHQDLPFEKLVEELRPERDASRTPLFQVMLTFQGPPEPANVLGELVLEPIEPNMRTAPFDLTLHLEEREGLTGLLEYGTDLYEAATVERMAACLRSLAGAIAADPERRVSELPLLSESEREEVLGWGAAPASSGERATFPERVAARAAEAPESVAVDAGDGEEVTYRELADRAAALAGWLQRAGVGPEVVVGLCAERSPDLIAGLLGTLWAGGAFLPLDPAYPRDRLAWMLSDSGARVLLTQERLLPELPEFSGTVLLLDREPQSPHPLAPSPVRPPSPHPERERGKGRGLGGGSPLPLGAAGGGRAGEGTGEGATLAYLIYTSGSTGRPKGVMVSHRGLANLAAEQARAFGVGPGSRVLQFASPSFDASVSEIVMALGTGATLCLAGRDELLPGPGLARLLQERRITAATLPPSSLAVLPETDLPDLSTLVVAGEACPPALAGRWGAGRRLFNAYGPTEGTVCATIAGPGPHTAAGRLSIGRPMAGVEAHVLDRHLRPMPAGVPGELCLGGAGLARGYLGRPDLTAERFVPHPFSPPGERLYRTGDRARWLPGGELDLLGRIDRQVKIRGVRVEPGEIEAALSLHPGVREAAVVVPAEGEQRLVACVVPRDGLPLAPAELRSFLAARLPDALIPTAWLFLDALPVAPGGKVDRRALARRAAEAGGAVGPHVAPRTPEEEMLAGLFAEVLGLPAAARVGAGDSFFDLGGHSLLATQLASRIREAFGVEVPLRVLFEAPTVAGLALQVARCLGEKGLQGQQGQQGPTAIRRVPRGGRLPLSFAQQRLWFLDQLEPGMPFYNVPHRLRLRGALRPEILEAALAELVRRHESLRTTFGDEGGSPFQTIAPAWRPPLPCLDLSGLPEGLRQSELDRLAGEEARRPFDLARGPLLRALLVRLAEDDHGALLTLHHIVSDGWSIGVLVWEMGTVYAAFAEGAPSPLPELPVQYADYAAWQRGWLQGETLEAQLAYWRERLANSPGLELPTDRPRPPVETFRGASRLIALSPGLSAAVRSLSRREGATLFMTLLAAFATLLHRVCGQSDVPVGTPIANRRRSEVEGLIGFFSNTLVLRCDLSGSPGFRNLLGRVREIALGAYAHQEIPFEKLVEEISPERDMSRNPLFQVMLVLQNQPRKALEVATGLTFASEDVDTGTAKFDLTLFFWEAEDRIAGLLEHNADLFDRTTAQRLFLHFERLLEAAAEEPGRSLLAIPLLSAAERHHLLLEWNERVDASGAAQDVILSAAKNLGGRSFPTPRSFASLRMTQQRSPSPGEWEGGRWERGPGGEALVCVHHQVEQQARETPDALAAVFEGRRLTYRELNVSANRLAHGLRRLGVGPEVRVGICVERSLEMVTALLAVLKAGGAAVALDPAYPADRLAFIVRDARMPVLLTQTPLRGLFPDGRGTTVLCLDGGEPFPDESPDDPESGVLPDHPMYAIYTSGTTGQPKGIVVPHRAFANLLAWQRAGSGLAPRARTAQLSTFGFCVSFQEIFSSWCAGSTLVVAGEMTRRDVDGLGGFLADEGIERLHLPFAALKHLAESTAGQDRVPERLREVVTAGEQLQVTPAVRALFERLPGCVLHNQYGASETHVVSALALTGPPAGWPDLPAVGRPIADVRIQLLDAALQPVPIGVPGELYAGGACLARGYLDDPELTAQKLIPDPFATLRGEPGARLYRTGDQARYRPDGRIEYHGRIDGQVKIRGFRVELGEVETTLARHPGVRDTAVLAVQAPEGHGGPRLVAWVVPAVETNGDGALFDELRAHLRQTLPDFMIPAAFVRMTALPLNANGKLDAAALPVPDSASLGRRAGYVAPRNAVEEVLAGLWRDVLGIDRVGVHDNFFALGGHSLLATQLASRVRATFRVQLPLRRLFETADLGELAAAVVALETKPGQSEAIARVLQRIRSMSPEAKQEALTR